ncbi:MAG: hypothetical protein HUU55_18780 [Myxococcales bacterium]|nr:hypothetical protein [Myxococcales bacterium]
MADRGYAHKEYCSAIAPAGGWFVIRFNADINPMVVRCFVDGQWKQELQGQTLQEIRAALQEHHADLQVAWARGEKQIR